MASSSARLVSRRTTCTRRWRACASSSARMRRPTPRPACRRRDPHALDLRRPPAVELQRTTTDRFAAEATEQQQSRRFGQLGRVGRDAQRGIESGVEARVELGEVRADAALRGVGGRILDGDLDETGRQQPGDRLHRGDERGALLRVERFQQRPRERVALPVEDGSVRARPAAVSRTVRTRLSARSGSTRTSRSCSSARKSRLT